MCHAEEPPEPESGRKAPIFKELNWKIMGDIDQCILFRMKATDNLNEANLTNRRAPGLVSTSI